MLKKYLATLFGFILLLLSSNSAFCGEIYGYESAADQERLELERNRQLNQSLQFLSEQTQRKREAQQQYQIQQQQIQLQQQSLYQQQVQQQIAAQQAYEAEQQRMYAAVQRVFIPIYQTRRNLLDQISSYVEGRAECKKKQMFNQVVATEVSEKLLQVPTRFQQGAKSINETWVDLPALLDVRDSYKRAFDGFAQSADAEIKGYRVGLMFWEASAQLEKSKALRKLAFEDTLKAFDKNKGLFLQIGMAPDAAEIKILDNDFEELMKLYKALEQ